MNPWLKLSLEFANQKNYLDELFRVYPLVPDTSRDLDPDKWEMVTRAFNQQDHKRLIESLLNLELFPIKDSYVSYLRRDKEAIARNPKTINRLCGRLYEMGLAEMGRRCREPKETNRQIGPMFRYWIQKGALGVLPLDWKRFHKSKQDSVMIGSDAEFKDYAAQYLGYSSDKGLDLICRFNGKIVVGEAKFLSDWGGNQNNQLEVVQHFLATDLGDAVKVGIIDGVPYIPSNNKMHKLLVGKLAKQNVMSALVLREFLYSL
ncbi:hypothetical protein [Ferrigenium sp. UT5]|uniref:hypothetical protein n=1 Tax=Ferrigenium sp. UT5 TaxID=3242105 RepID=UPI00354B6370